MSKSLLLVNVEPPEIRIAEIQDGRLSHLDFERAGRLLGNVYKGRVENIIPGMDAAFVDVGLNRNALIYVGDVGPENANPNATIQTLLSRGEEILVQVARPPVGQKGARVTTQISLPGRYVVLTSNTETIGVSRRIESDSERNRLRKLAERLRPLDHGLIVRTEAENVSDGELARDVEFVGAQLQKIRQRASEVTAPRLLHRELGLLGRIARDRLTENVDQVLIDSEDVFKAFGDLVRSVAPHLENRLSLYKEAPPLFDKYHVNLDISRACERSVPLPHGGGLSVDETEALTAIDVNTGKFIGKNRLADTVLQTNLEAVDEAARQIRLRDLGGVIVIDFIDMERNRDRIKVLNALEAALKLDRRRTRIVQISPSGLVEITRRREGSSLRQLLHRSCPYCGGDGVVKTASTAAIETRRNLREAALRSPDSALQVTLRPDVACALLGPDNEYLRALEETAKTTVFVKVDFNIHMEANRIETGTVATFQPEGIEVGTQLTLPRQAPLLPEVSPLFSVSQGRLVHLENSGELQLNSEQKPTHTPAVVEVTEVFRWFIRAKILVTEPLGA